MPVNLPNVMLVVDRVLYRTREDEQVLSLVEEAIAGGVSLVQMRMSAWRDDELGAYAAALRLREITRDRASLMVADDLNLAEKCHADGVLLTSEHGYRPESVRQYVRTVPSIVGCFVTSVRGAARAERGGADFVQVGPVFESERKSSGSDGLNLLRKVRDAVHVPVVAFGGISSPERVAASIAAGARAIAVSTPILSARDPRKAAQKFSSVFAELA
jgi:thiamine-phosphate pyrophosphorylase